jgi:hypothetical protein
MYITNKQRLYNILLSGFLFILLHSCSFAQDSCHYRISLLTCSPGDELYSTFGHSALRVMDSTRNLDIVYNYGTFDFDEPGFYTKFTRGKLMYYLSTEYYENFQQQYKLENRAITEQVLNFNCQEKHRIINLLYNNLQGSNKFYKYDFLFDNCTTRLRDIIASSADSTVVFNKVVKVKTRYRQLLYEYLNFNDKQWSKLGIDLLLGARTDAIMDEKQVMFLPDYLMKSIASAKIGDKPLVLATQNVTGVTPEPVKTNYLIHPLVIFTAFLLLMVRFSASKKPSVQRRMARFDSLLFFLLGVIGVLILFMWFGTDHIACRDNYNLLWAWPTHIVAAFFINRNGYNIKWYFKATALLNTILLLVWFFLPQHLNTAFIPLVLLIIFRSAVRANKAQL